MDKKIKSTKILRVIFCAIFAFSLFVATGVGAQPTANSSARSKGGPFGLGVILGDPSGPSAKYFLNDPHALDFDAGFGVKVPVGVEAIGSAGFRIDAAIGARYYF